MVSSAAVMSYWRIGSGFLRFLGGKPPGRREECNVKGRHEGVCVR